jgi:type I restriction enzyme S subunit
MAVQHVRLGDVLELQRRKVALDATEEYVEVGLRSFGKGIFHKPAVTGAELGSKKVYRIEPGDLVISNVFAWEGAVAVASESERGLIGSHRFMTWIPRNADRVNVRYLWHYFLPEPGLLHLRRASPGSAGRNRTLGISAFEDIKLPLPELTEQRRVAARLDLISAMTTSFGTPPTAALRDGLLDSVPQRSRLGDIATLARRPVSVKARETYPNLGLLNRARGAFRKPPLLGSETKYSTLYMVHAGQLIYSKLFGWEGSLAIVPEWADGWFVSSEFPTYDITPDTVDPDYFGQVLRWHGLAAQLADATSGMGQRRQRVQTDQFEELKVPLPDLAAQRRIGSELRRLAMVEDLAAHRATLADALLPAARNEAFAELT